MLVSSSSSFSPLAFGRLGTGLNIRSDRRSGDVGAATDSGASVRDVARLTLKLRRAVDTLQDSLSIRSRGSAAKAASTQSATALAISTAATASTLRSTQEINSTPTSFSPRGPSFSGSSTSSPTIGGVYDGDQGDNTLTFRVLVGGVVGVAPIQVDIVDDEGQAVDSVSFEVGYVGADKTLSNGLTFSLGSGTVLTGDEFDVTVSSSVGGSVDPSKPFNGTRNDNPNFDPSLSVTAGLLDINGIAISVTTTDSINSVLTKITDSAAGVTASFDATTESVILTQKTAGSAPPINLGSDTSGFFAATKLTGASVTAGDDDERTQTIASVAAFSGIGSGSFSVNGTLFNVDVSTDSLDDVMATINQSNAGAQASFDATTNKFAIRSTSSNPLQLDDGTSGFFSGLGVTTGEFEPESGTSRGVKFRDATKLQDEIEGVQDAVNDLFKLELATLTAPAGGFVRNALQSAFAEAFGAEEGATRFGAHGIQLDFDDDEVFDTDFSDLRRAIEDEPREVLETFSDRTTGLLPLLDDAFEDIADRLGYYLGRNSGVLVDLES